MSPSVQVFKTPASDGPFRDEVVVEVLTLNDVAYSGTITPAEARGMMYECALGLDQANLASITIGYNRGRVITFKLRQQIDIDDLYKQEYFEIERRAGDDVQVIACKIRGVRNPAARLQTQARPTTSTARARSSVQDDGTRIVRIIGCEFHLSESEILGWLSCFGEVISEITEEQFEMEDVLVSNTQSQSKSSKKSGLEVALNVSKQ